MSAPRPGASVFAFACALSLLLAAAAAPASTQFLRRPDVHGDQVVFTSEGDLWLGSIENGTASRITSDDGVEGPAYFSPDGRRIAFTAQYDGGTDVYVMEVSGGSPQRLTYDPTGALTLGWTPDGKEVLFRSRRDQGTWRHRLWAVPVGGGPARLLPIPYGEFAAVNADGHRIAYVPVSAEWQHWKRYHGGQADDVWLADTTAHTFRRLTDDPGVDSQPHWLGDRVVFVSERDGHPNLWTLDPAGGAPVEATHYTDGGVRYPGTDGHRVVFEHGDGLGLWDPSTGETRELSFALHSDRIHARPRIVSALDQLFGVALGPTGKRLLVSARGQILSAPVEHGDVRPAASEPGSRCQLPAWSPDGKQLAFVSDESGEEQVWVAPATGGAPKQLSRDHKGPLGPLVWSPDGKWIATSDHEMRVLLVDAKSGAITVVDQADRGGSYDLVNDSYCFSPDGRWLAFARLEPNWNWTIQLYDIASGHKTRISSPEMTSDAPAFDPEGKFLYFLSDRAFDPHYQNANRYFTFDKFTKVSLVTLAADTPSPFLPENEEEGAAASGAEKKPDKETKGKKEAGKSETLAPTRVDLNGLTDRVVEVPVPADRYVRVEPVEGRLLIATREEAGSENDDGAGKLRLLTFDLKKRKLKTLVADISGFEVSTDHKKLLVQREKTFSVGEAGGEEFDFDKGMVKTDAWTLHIDPAAEWRQMFEETWRLGRDFFYDPGMHGVDWNAVRERYRAQMPAVADRSDLSFIQGEMVAELNCGHAYIIGGDVAHGKRVPMGFLGADFEPVTGPTPAYRITKLYPGDGFDLEARSPLLAPGVDVKPGDYVLAVGGRPVRADQDLQALLVGTAGKVTRLTVNGRPSLTGAREVRVVPMASERMARYYDWVESRVEYVRRYGGDNIGYLHLPSMLGSGLQAFAKHYYPNLTKDGMIYDVRFNGGGYIDAMLLLQMSSKPYSYFKPRYGASWTRIDWGFPGHSVALCNDQSYSDAEEFSDAFQRLGLGPVIGVPTWGGEVGSGGGYPLLDGGKVYIPNYGEWVPGAGWVIEGRGVQPDIVVEEDPAALMKGRDPQLDRAIAVLKDELAKSPVVRPTPPPFPKKAAGE